MITWILYSIHSSAQSHFHNIRIYTKERNIFVVLSFYLLMVISMTAFSGGKSTEKNILK